MNKIKNILAYIYCCIYKVAGDGAGRYILFMTAIFFILISALLAVIVHANIKIALWCFAPIYIGLTIYFLAGQDSKIVEAHKGVTFSYVKSLLIFLLLPIIALSPLAILILLKIYLGIGS